MQRELLLDTVMQNSPVALLLVDAQERIAYANIAARHLLSEGRSLTGLHFGDALMRAPPALRGAVAGAGDSLFSTEIEGSEETFHLSQRAFILQGRTFRLYLLKRLTRELSRQEVATWKKLIRVLSHELNNSLGPLSSLAHSGAEIARRADQSTLPAVFAAIAERAEHLHQFVSGYATFARLPAPRPQPVAWDGFAADLARQQRFTLAAALPAVPGWFDRAQVDATRDAAKANFTIKTQNVARLVLHRTIMDCGANAQARFQRVIEVTNGDAGHYASRCAIAGPV